MNRPALTQDDNLRAFEIAKFDRMNADVDQKTRDHALIDITLCEEDWKIWEGPVNYSVKLLSIQQRPCLYLRGLRRDVLRVTIFPGIWNHELAKFEQPRERSGGKSSDRSQDLQISGPFFYPGDSSREEVKNSDPDLTTGGASAQQANHHQGS
ncbi:hypothetical protein NP233_g435 [Leucocoprinus birnbaumii]|uniref:Uncharacterized protein n=1 Tax=Leucocoprinus birnbaumii TaxID=56174 RepID=A0AAD5W253_9AGAR|nr:hypothetical protein NP233_g435 [Leucocoprinus birnbaumii]